MELREFAEQVLFSTRLEDKLRAPVELSDECPGSPVLAPDMPGRPESLRFRSRDSGPRDFPGTKQLENAAQRGRLLHFFANHELLATELMALVLLRFPGAPASFRRGVLQTLKDEQEHTRLYIERMQACGVEFGQLPVSGYFWRAVSSMENPLDYVTSLSLTFEQANLDFAQHFARTFSAVGDRPTAELLEKIHRDEIAHVAYGLKWFRRWKNPTETDWDAFCRQLKFPLSPQRAKGFAVNTQARRAAGLDPQFIAELTVFSQSKGRTPGVYVFNPFSEGYVAQGWSFTPVKHQQQLARDLANLPQFLCRRDDVVLVEEKPSVEFLGELQKAGFVLPEFVELERDRASVDPMLTLRQRRLSGLHPWAWGPDSVRLLEPLTASVAGDHPIPLAAKSPEKTARLYSKGWAAQLLRAILGHYSEDWLCTEAAVGIVANTAQEALEAIAAIRGRNHHRVVVKQAIGLAGHNAIRLWEPELLDAQRKWIENVAATGGSMIIEPWLERLFDFSIQLEMRPNLGAGRLEVLGYTGLITDAKGQYRGNWLAPHHNKRLPLPVASLLAGPKDISTRLSSFYAAVISRLEAGLRDAGYWGPVGIDAFVFRDGNGRARLKPIVEINPRFTMGRLGVELMKRAAPGSYGTLRLWNRALLQRAGFANFQSHAIWLREQHPLQLVGEPLPRIWEGAVCLNEPQAAQACLAVFEVTRRMPGEFATSMVPVPPL